MRFARLCPPTRLFAALCVTQGGREDKLLLPVGGKQHLNKAVDVHMLSWRETEREPFISMRIICANNRKVFHILANGSSASCN